MTFTRGAVGGMMTEAGSGSVWNFQGCAVEGTMAGAVSAGGRIAQGLLVRLDESSSGDDGVQGVEQTRGLKPHLIVRS